MNLTQVLINSLITSAELGMIAIGLTMTFGILQFANFAHTATGVLGAYIAFVLNVTLGWNFALALLLAALLMGGVGMLFDRCIFRIMRHAGDVTPMIASLGLSIMIQNSIQALWGPHVRQYNFEIRPGIRIWGGYITIPQIWIVVIVVIAMLAFHLLLQYTKMGKAMRATATNPELAQACAISTEGIIQWVWFMGTAFATIGGILVGWDTQLDPYMGFVLNIPVFCVILVGGVGSIYGAMLGAVIVGFAQNFGIAFDFAHFINMGGLFHVVERLRLPVAYKPAIVYGAIILLLLLRPSGLAKREG